MFQYVRARNVSFKLWMYCLSPLLPPFSSPMGGSRQYRVEQHDIVSNKTWYRLVRRDVRVPWSKTRHVVTPSHRRVLDLDDHHTRHHRPSNPLFLIDQRQRDGCDDLPVARRSSGKKGGGGWGGGRREVRYERWGTKPPPSRTKIVVRLLIRVERPEGCAMGDKSPP